MVTAQPLWLADHWASEILSCGEMRMDNLFNGKKDTLLAFYFLIDNEVFIAILALEIWSSGPVISTSNAVFIKKINYKTKHESGRGWFDADLNGLFFTEKSFHLSLWNTFTFFLKLDTLSQGVLCCCSLFFASLFFPLKEENSFILMKSSCFKKHPTKFGSTGLTVCIFLLCKSSSPYSALMR